MMKIYVSGRISGNPQHEIEFRKAAINLHAGGHRAVVPQDIPPHEHDGPCPPSYAAAAGSHHTAACYLRTDISLLLTCDAIYMLRGWESSVGARLEHTVAATCGLKVLYEEVDELQKRIRVGTIIQTGPPDDGLRGPSTFQGDASRLLERQYEGDE